MIEDDEDDLDLEVMFVDDRLYRAWLHVHLHVQQSSILFVAVVIVVAVVVEGLSIDDGSTKRIIKMKIR